MNGLDKIIAQILDDAESRNRLRFRKKQPVRAETTLAAAGVKGKKAGGRAGEIGGAA
ncbi:MAG: hypothetical protein ACLR8P_21120 [Clostridium fessum]